MRLLRGGEVPCTAEDLTRVVGEERIDATIAEKVDRPPPPTNRRLFVRATAIASRGRPVLIAA